jgi:Protein of unknown function (DUF3421)
MDKKYLSTLASALGITIVSLGSLVTMIQPALADYRWVSGRNGSVPPGAIKGGFDNGDLYVCKVNNTNGKLHPKYGRCYISYGGKEQEFTTYEVLVGTDINWFSTYYSSMPKNPIVTGYEQNGTPLYACRSRLQMGQKTLLMPGKYNDLNKICYLPYGGKEHEVRLPVEIVVNVKG